MPKLTSSPAIPSGRLTPFLWIGLLIVTLAIFGGAVFAITIHIRADLRERIVNRAGETFTAVAQMLLEETSENARPEIGDLFATALQTSKLSRVMAVRLYSPEGRFLDSVPFDARDRELSPEDLAALNNLHPLSFFEPDGDLDSVFAFKIPDHLPARTPLLHIAIPLYAGSERELAAIAYYTLDGNPIADEFREVDRSLALQGAIVFTAGGSLFLIAAGIAWWRLSRAQRLLRERTRRLLQANQELSLAARTSAVGAVSAHLVHGLKNSLAGLNEFVKSAAEGPESRTDPEEWESARESAGRMRAMIEEVVSILRDDDQTTQYEMNVEELVELVDARIASLDGRDGNTYQSRVEAGGSAAVSGRDANLITLILTNLIDNAFRAGSGGCAVSLNVAGGGNGDGLVFEVTDNGPGIPLDVRENLFSPRKAGSNGGTGLGLAISYQLAQHLGAELALTESGETGSRFRLALPEHNTGINRRDPAP